MIVQDESDEFDAIPADDSEATKPPGLKVACIGGRSHIDDVAAEMLAQALMANGAETHAYQHSDLAPTRIEALDVASMDCLILNFLDPAPSRASLLHIRRLSASRRCHCRTAPESDRPANRGPDQALLPADTTGFSDRHWPKAPQIPL